MNHTERLIAAARDVIDRLHPTLTPGQRGKMAATVAAADSFEICREQGIAFPADNELELIIGKVIRENPSFTREVPTAKQVYDFTTKGSDLDPGSRISEWRRITALSPDQLLEIVGDAKLDPPNEATPIDLGKFGPQTRIGMHYRNKQVQRDAAANEVIGPPPGVDPAMFAKLSPATRIAMARDAAKKKKVG